MRVEVNWEYVGADETGCFIKVEFNCPACEEYVLDVLFTRKTQDELQYGFEVDYKCDICGEDLVLLCYPD